MPRTPDEIRKELHVAEEAARAAAVRVDALYIELRDAMRPRRPAPTAPAAAAATAPAVTPEPKKEIT